MNKAYSYLLITLFALISLQGFAQTRTDSLHVAHYDLHLNISDFENEQIGGHCAMKVVSEVNGLSNIQLDLAASFTIDSLKLENNLFTSFTHQNHLLTINHTLNQNDTVSIIIYYHGSPVTDPMWGGFNYTPTIAYNIGVGMGSVPPTVGRFWYPCIDDFKDKSTYQLHITTANNHKAVCGGILIDSTFTENDKTWVWELTDPVPSYLVSVAVGEYQVYKDTFNSLNGEVPIEIYATSNYIHNAANSFIHLKDVLHYYEDLMGPYMWQRIGYVGVPFYAGAMEHATNIAYPQTAIDGSLANQFLIYHEIAHAWFGNLITCAAAHEMWINEGIGSYYEHLAHNVIDPSGAAFKETMRELHANVLNKAHSDDGDYYAIDNVPAEATYGTHSYDKGALVTHSLRGYLGNNTFFEGLKTLLANKRFSNLNSNELCTQLGEITGTDLSSFYEDWVHQAGFLHFYIDSIVPISGNQYAAHLRQRTYHAEHTGTNIPIDILFIDTDGDPYLVEDVVITAETSIVEVSIPFTPDYAIVDPLEKLGDAVLDQPLFVDTDETYHLSNLYLRFKANTFNGEFSNWWMEHHYLAPDPVKNENSNIFDISETHFWKITAFDTNIPTGRLDFQYAAGNPTHRDYELLHGQNKDNFVLIYRKNHQHDWEVISTLVIGTNSVGYLSTTDIRSGEYAIALGNPVAIQENENLNKSFILYPNPAQEWLTISANETISETLNIEIYDMKGSLILQDQKMSFPCQISTEMLTLGNYILRISNAKGTVFTGQFEKLEQ